VPHGLYPDAAVGSAGLGARLPVFRLRAMKALTISRARSVCGPGWRPIRARCPRTRGNRPGRRRLVGRCEFLLRRRQHVVVERALHDQERHHRDRLAAFKNFLRVRLVDGVPRTKNVLLFFIMLSRFFSSAFWKRAKVLLIGERVATYATVASLGAEGSGIAL